MRDIQPPLLRALRGTLAISLAAAAVHAQAQSPWKIIELKGPEGTFSVIPFCVDANRNVYGQTQGNVGNVTGIRPTRWLASTGYKPEFLGNQDGFLRGVNGKGFSVGLQEMTGPPGGPSGKPILWAPDGTSTFLEGLPSYSRAEGISINATNMVAGTMWSTASNGYRPFRWQNGEGIELPAVQDYGYSYSTGINNAGFVVGYGLDSFSAPTISTGWFWSPTGGLQKLPAVGTFYRANSVNNTGLICGFAKYNNVGSAVIWPFFGKPAILPSLPGFAHAEAFTVNDGGMVGGNIWSGRWNSRTVSHPAEWIEGVCHDIAAEAPVANMVYGTARGMNSRGDVVGDASFSGHSSGFIAIRK